MKGSGKIICGILAVVGLLLLYVHGQTSLFELSYRMDTQSKLLARKSEEYRRLRFEVEQLKAPLLLEGKMKEMSLHLTLPKEVRVVKIAPAEPLPNAMVQSDSLSNTSNGFLRFLGRWVDIAQAKTDR